MTKMVMRTNNDKDKKVGKNDENNNSDNDSENNDG